MKKHLFMILAIVPFSVFSMDIELQDRGKQEKLAITSANVEEIVQAIDTAINKKYPQTIGSFFTGKTEADQVNILRVPQTYSPPIKVNDLLIEKLISKNTKFSDALAYFSDIKNVNCNTLQLIESNPEDSQIPKCYNVCQAIRFYIRKLAQASIKKVNPYYEIILHNKYKYPISLYSICPEKDLAITYDKVSSEIVLWDLKIGKHSHLSNTKHITALEFAPWTTNPLLFIGETQKNVGPMIRIWDIERKKELAQMTCYTNTEYIIEDFSFSIIETDTPLTLVSALIKNRNVNAFIKQWILTPTEFVRSHQTIPASTSFRFDQKMMYGSYQINNSEYFRDISQLRIFKYNCHHFYFCEQAAKTITSSEDIQKITSSQSYKSLTENQYERNTINEQIAAKMKKN